MFHLLIECEAAAEVCEWHEVPDCRLFLRQFLLSRTSVELASLSTDLLALMDSGTTSRARRQSSLPTLPLDSRVDIGRETFVLRFDGSYQGGRSAGIGITLEIQGHPPFATFSTPLSVCDA